MVKNYSIGGVASTLQLGKNGASLHSVIDATTNNEIVFVVDKESKLANIRIADPVNDHDAAAKGWVVGTNIPVNSELPTLYLEKSSTVTQAIVAITNQLGILDDKASRFNSTLESKLAGIQANATTNSSDIFLLDRSNHTGVQPLSSITGVGTAATKNHQTSKIDATNDSLMVVGAFGLGGDAIPIAGFDFDVNRVSGLYGCDTATNGPVPNFTGIVEVSTSPQVVKQVASNSGNTWVRYGNNATWYSWSKMTTVATQVGLVSDGAVIERGVGNNGSYIKFADGTLICTSKDLPLQFVDDRELSTIWTYQHVFVEAPVVTANLSGFQFSRTKSINTFGAFATSSANSEISVVLDTLSTFIAEDAIGVTVNVMAVGRWK